MNFGISGKLTSGKTTIANQFDSKIVAIGNSIKKTAGYLIEEQNKLQEYLVSVIGEASEDIFPNLQKEFHNNFRNGDWIRDNQTGFYVKNQEYRDLLQAVGDIVREPLGKDIWCRMTLQEALNLIQEGHSVICDDIRLQEEKKIFEDAGFPIIRLNISKEKQIERAIMKYGEVNEKQLNHFTETDLDGAIFPLTLDTTFDTVSETTDKVKNFIFKGDKLYV